MQGLAALSFFSRNTSGGVSPRSISALTNTTDQLCLLNSINDFVPNNTTGQARFLEAEKRATLLMRYFMDKDRKAAQLCYTLPRQQTEVVFTITPPPGASRATRYGACYFLQANIRQDTVIVTQK